MADFLWVEQYRPKTIEDCILPDQTKKTFLEFLKKKERKILKKLIGENQ